MVGRSQPHSGPIAARNNPSGKPAAQLKPVHVHFLEYRAFEHLFFRHVTSGNSNNKSSVPSKEDHSSHDKLMPCQLSAPLGKECAPLPSTLECDWTRGWGLSNGARTSSARHDLYHSMRIVQRRYSSGPWTLDNCEPVVVRAAHGSKRSSESR